MVVLGLIFWLVVVPLFWGLLVAIAEVFIWQSDKATAKRLSPTFGRDIYDSAPLAPRVTGAFKRGCWTAFKWTFWSVVLLALAICAFSSND